MRGSFALLSLLAVLLTAACSLGPDQRMAAGDDDEFGIGGTGILARDASGIVGRITGFGSIFVNGIEIEISANTELRRNGQRIDGVDLAIGDVVEVLVRDQQAYTHALQLNIRHELIGPIDSIDDGGMQLEVAGQRVRLSQPLTGWQPGDQVAVAGLRDNDGVIHASRITPSTANEILLRGELSRHGDGYRIGGQEVMLPQASPRPGGAVVVRGTRVEDRLLARAVLSEPLLPYRGIKRWRIEGFANRYPSRGMVDPESAKATIFDLVSNPDGSLQLSPLERHELPRGSTRPLNEHRGSGPRRTPSPGSGGTGGHRGRH